MRKSYMIAVQVTVKPVIYFEVIADSAAEAIAEIREDVEDSVKNNVNAYVDEFKTDLADVELKNIKVLNAGVSSLFHHAEGCEVCSSLELPTIELESDDAKT